MIRLDQGVPRRDGTLDASIATLSISRGPIDVERARYIHRVLRSTSKSWWIEFDACYPQDDQARDILRTAISVPIHGFHIKSFTWNCPVTGRDLDAARRQRDARIRRDDAQDDQSRPTSWSDTSSLEEAPGASIEPSTDSSSREPSPSQAATTTHHHHQQQQQQPQHHHHHQQQPQYHQQQPQYHHQQQQQQQQGQHQLHNQPRSQQQESEVVSDEAGSDEVVSDEAGSDEVVSDEAGEQPPDNRMKEEWSRGRARMLTCIFNSYPVGGDIHTLKISDCGVEYNLMRLMRGWLHRTRVHEVEMAETIVFLAQNRIPLGLFPLVDQMFKRSAVKPEALLFTSTGGHYGDVSVLDLWIRMPRRIAFVDYDDDSNSHGWTNGMSLLCQLFELKISGVPLGITWEDELVRLVKDSDSHLQTLHMERVRLDRGEPTALFDALKFNHMIISICLDVEGICQESAEALVEYMAEFRTVKYLTFGNLVISRDFPNLADQLANMLHDKHIFMVYAKNDPALCLRLMPLTFQNLVDQKIVRDHHQGGLPAGLWPLVFERINGWDIVDVLGIEMTTWVERDAMPPLHSNLLYHVIRSCPTLLQSSSSLGKRKNEVE